MQGGINADGTFHVGFAFEQPSTGQSQYARADGRIATAGGIPTGLTMTDQITGTSTALDCDVEISTEAQYVGGP